MLSLVQAMNVSCSCVPRIATGFGAGIGRLGDVCGAISGAAMAIGVSMGRDDPSDVESKELTYSKVVLLTNAFNNEFGSLRCRDLIGCDLNTKEGREEANRKRIHSDICPRFVAFATREAWHLIRG